MTALVYRHWHEGMDPNQCVSVDGDAPGRLHLSHWRGNRTPAQFKHMLSTGSCLLFNKAADRERLLQGITTVTNNHWDADGLCAAFAILQPKLAAEYGPVLLATAMAGDFDHFSSPEGVKINLTINALAKHAYSPVRTGLFGTALEARAAQYEHGLKLLPTLLANPDLHADWFAREYWTIMQDMRAIREDHVKIKYLEYMDTAVVTTDRVFHTMAVNTATETGRVMSIVELETGECLFEYRYTTRSWFDYTGPSSLKPRYDWSRTAELMNLLCPSPGGTWVADDWREPNARLRFQDSQGRLAPHVVKARDVVTLMVSGQVEPSELPKSSGRVPHVPEPGP